MDIQQQKLKNYCRLVILLMGRYSKSTVLKTVDLLKSESTIKETQDIIEQNLSEKDFLRKIEKILQKLDTHQ